MLEMEVRCWRWERWDAGDEVMGYVPVMEWWSAVCRSDEMQVCVDSEWKWSVCKH